MKKTLFVLSALALVLCFSISASAKSVFTLSVDSVNTAPTETDTVIYTRDFGEKVPVSQGEYYVITVIPKITDSVVSENDNGNGEVESSVVVSEDISVLPEASEEVSEAPQVSSEDTVSLPEVSDVIPEVITSDSVAETASQSEYRYKVENIYSPASMRDNIIIPENGFAVLVRGSENEGASSGEESNISDSSAEARAFSLSDVEAGTPVAVYGVDFEGNTISENAYLEFDLSNKDLLGDVPQTSDSGAVVLFTVVASLSVLSAIWFFSRKRIA